MEIDTLLLSNFICSGNPLSAFNNACCYPNQRSCIFLPFSAHHNNSSHKLVKNIKKERGEGARKATHKVASNTVICYLKEIVNI